MFKFPDEPNRHGATLVDVHYATNGDLCDCPRVAVDVGDRDIRIYRTAVERVLNTLFNLEFEA